MHKVDQLAALLSDSGTSFDWKGFGCSVVLIAWTRMAQCRQAEEKGFQKS